MLGLRVGVIVAKQTVYDKVYRQNVRAYWTSSSPSLSFSFFLLVAPFRTLPKSRRIMPCVLFPQIPHGLAAVEALAVLPARGLRRVHPPPLPRVPARHLGSPRRSG